MGGFHVICALYMIHSKDIVEENNRIYTTTDIGGKSQKAKEFIKV
jgi:hypothetical protein